MNNDNRYSSHNHHDYDDMDKLKHEHGITDEHGEHKDQHQEHHAGHDHSGHSGHDHHHGNFKELFLKSLPLGIIIMLLSPMYGFELPFQFTFPYSDIVVAILSTKYLASHEKRQSALLLYNIEALAANSEHADIGHCYGTGTLDCPVSHDKVKYIAGGYSLEGLY